MSHKIAVIPGDGTGPEVVVEGLKCLKAAAEKCGFKYETVEFDFGGERYKRTGETLPDSALEELKTFNTIYLGAIGHPDVKPGILEKGILLRTRFELDQYINLRPVKLYPNVDCPLKDKGPEEIDFVVVRENTEGLYAGSGGFLKKGTPDEIATQESVNTRKGVERCLRYAFELTRKRNRDNTLTLCGKTNVLTYAFDLWERVFHEVGEPIIPTSNATTPTWTPPACGWSKIPSGSTSSSPTTCSETSSPTLGRWSREAWASPPAATSTPKASPCSSPSAALRPSIPARASSTPSPGLQPFR